MDTNVKFVIVLWILGKADCVMIARRKKPGQHREKIRFRPRRKKRIPAMPVERIVFKSRDEWLEARKSQLGGSDASCCLGLNPYKSNVELWEEKTGRRQQEDISDKPYVKYGILAEPLLRELFAMDHPQYQVYYEEHNMFVNSDYPWMHASLDGELLDEDRRHGVLEIKTTQIMQSTQWLQWEDKIPDPYYIQILHCLAVTGYEFAKLKAQIKYERDGEVKLSTNHYTIERKDVLADIEAVIEAERRFWGHVVSGEKPDLILPAI